MFIYYKKKKKSDISKLYFYDILCKYNNANHETEILIKFYNIKYTRFDCFVDYSLQFMIYSKMYFENLCLFF